MHADHKLQLKRIGQKQWLEKLLADGRLDQASAYAAKNKLDMPGGAGISAPEVVKNGNQSSSSEIFSTNGRYETPVTLTTGEGERDVLAELVEQGEQAPLGRSVAEVLKERHERETANCALRVAAIEYGAKADKRDGTDFPVPEMAEAKLPERRAELAPEWETLVEVKAEEPVPFAPTREVLPMGVRWAEIRGHTRNLRLKVVRFCEGGHEALLWIGWKDLNRMGRSVGRVVVVVPNPDVEQGNFVLWRR